jgi:hypothetical protein
MGNPTVHTGERTSVGPLAVITNHFSAHNQRRGCGWVASMLADELDTAHFEIHHPGGLIQALRQCAAMGTETIVVNGGDGTAGMVFSGLLNDRAFASPPILGLLSGGKTNMMAANWGLSGNPEVALSAILRHRREGTLSSHVVDRRVLALERTSNLPPLYGGFFGAAEIVEATVFWRRHFYPLNVPDAVGHAATIAVFVWRGLISGGTSGEVAATEAGRSRETRRFSLVAATTLDELVLGIRPIPEEASSSAYDRLCYLSVDIGPGAIINAVAEAMRGRISSGAGRTVRRTKWLTLNFNGRYVFDGEVYETRADQPLTLSADKRLRFIRLPA